MGGWLQTDGQLERWLTHQTSSWQSTCTAYQLEDTYLSTKERVDVDGPWTVVGLATKRTCSLTFVVSRKLKVPSAMAHPRPAARHSRASLSHSMADGFLSGSGSVQCTQRCQSQTPLCHSATLRLCASVARSQFGRERVREQVRTKVVPIGASVRTQPLTATGAPSQTSTIPYHTIPYHTIPPYHAIPPYHSS